MRLLDPEETIIRTWILEVVSMVVLGWSWLMFDSQALKCLALECLMMVTWWGWQWWPKYEEQNMTNNNINNYEQSQGSQAMIVDHAYQTYRPSNWNHCQPVLATHLEVHGSEHRVAQISANKSNFIQFHPISHIAGGYPPVSPTASGCRSTSAASKCPDSWKTAEFPNRNMICK